MKREVGIFIGKQTTISPATCPYTFVLRSNGQTIGAQIQLKLNGVVTHTFTYSGVPGPVTEVTQIVNLTSNVNYSVVWFNPSSNQQNVGLQIFDGSGNLIYELPFNSTWSLQLLLYLLTPSCPVLGQLDYFKLELFNDEKINVSSTIQNISDISKIFTDFSQGFTIPCSPTNNAIFQHFYQNDVDATFDYQNRHDAYIEVDTILFRRGKLQLEKANLKDGKANSYSVTFYGAGVSLKDYFKEDKLSQLDYSTIDHEYTDKEVYDRITIDSLVTDYDVRYPLISSKRVWQFGSSVPLPTANLPEWYNYPSNNENNLGHTNGRLFYNELFPAVRVASIFDLIQAEYGITFNGLFLQTDLFKKAFLWFKNKDKVILNGNAIPIDIQSVQYNNLYSQTAFILQNNTFKIIPATPSTSYTTTHTLQIFCTALTIDPLEFFVDVYKNGVFSQAFTYNTLMPYTNTTPLTDPFTIDINNSDTAVFTFKVRANSASVINFDFRYTRKKLYFGGSVDTGIATAYSSQTTSGFTNLAQMTPDIKISDFVSGICKEFNMTITSPQKDVFTFDPLPVWYGKGTIKDITKYTDVSSIEIERIKLYKSIEFKYQDSECFMNKYFLENPLNVDAHGYGNAKIGFDYDGGEYKIESPFENLLHCNFGNQLQVGYALNKELTSYIPKPCLLYMNQITSLTSGHIHYDGSANINEYVPFGQDTNILNSLGGFFPVTLNFGAEISSFYNVVNIYTLYKIYYSNYLENLYNVKNRLVKVKTILPISLLTTLELNDRLVIRDKRYLINEMQSDLTTGDVNFSLISDFEEVKPIQYEISPVGTGSVHKMAIYFSNGATQVRVSKSANASNVTLSSVLFTSEGFLIIGVPANAKRTITISLDTDYTNGNTDTSYIIINQV
jgi:hypothetical protein